MKIPALLAANVLIVGAGIMTYDVLRTEPPTAADGTDGVAAVDLSALDDRLDDLERRLDGISSIKADREVTSRLLQLENRLASLTAKPVAATAELAPTEPAAPAAAVATGETSGADEKLGDLDVAKIKRAMEELENDRERQRSARSTERMVERLGLNLTDDQKARLTDEFATFRSKVRDNFRNGRAEGLTREDMIANMETMRTDFGKSLTEFLPQSDADAIVEGMAEGMGSGRRGPGGPGGGGGIR